MKLIKARCAWGGVFIGSSTAGSSEGGAPVDEGSTITFAIGCDEGGVYMVFEEDAE